LLEASGLALGVVSGIAGQTWLHIAVEGVQNHGGEVLQVSGGWSRGGRKVFVSRRGGGVSFRGR
jgi:hypothetical protein